MAQVRGGDGAVIAEFQEEIRSRGQERIELVADAAGTFTFVVKAADGMIRSGSYIMYLDDRRPAVEADRSLYKAKTGGRNRIFA